MMLSHRHVPTLLEASATMTMSRHSGHAYNTSYSMSVFHRKANMLQNIARGIYHSSPKYYEQAYAAILTPPCVNVLAGSVDTHTASSTAVLANSRVAKSPSSTDRSERDFRVSSSAGSTLVDIPIAITLKQQTNILILL